jgi:hypothetical protein
MPAIRCAIFSRGNTGSWRSFAEIPRRIRSVGMAPSPAVIPSVSEESAVGNWEYGGKWLEIRKRSLVARAPSG